MIKHGQTAVELPGITAVYIGSNQVYGVPAGYTRLAGITYAANTYYEITGFRLRGSDTVRFSASFDKACNVFGCYTTTSAQDNYSLYISASSGSKYLRYNGGTYASYVASNQFGTQYNIVITPTGSSGLPNSNGSWTEQDFVTSTDMCIGTTSVSATSSKFDGDIYGDFVVDGRFRGVPVQRISDGAVGYYDVYTNQFYAPIGSNPQIIAYA